MPFVLTAMTSAQSSCEILLISYTPSYINGVTLHSVVKASILIIISHSDVVQCHVIVSVVDYKLVEGDGAYCGGVSMKAGLKGHVPWLQAVVTTGT